MPLLTRAVDTARRAHTLSRRLPVLHSYGISTTKTKFEVEPTFCILCGLCVRYCAEVKKKNAIGFIGRGTEREVVFFPEIAREECPNCEECYSLYPTGVFPSHYALAEAHHST